MSHFNQEKYEELISNNDFISWASGKDQSNNNHWDTWINNNPEYSVEFDKANESVRLMKFNPPELSKNEVKYLWNKTKEEIKNSEKRQLISTITSWYGRVAAVLLIPIIIFSAWLYLNNRGIHSELNNVVEYNSSKLITVTAPLGGRLNFELPDGSQVWLNSGTEIKYPGYFENNERRITVLGEAYFKIKKDKNPFIVQNSGIDVKVYGTEFNVNAYDDEEDVVVALVEGKVAMDAKGKEVFLKPGEASFYDKENKKLTIKEVNLDQFISWREGKLIFRDMPLNSIIKVLQRQFNADIVLADPELAGNTYNAMFKEESLKQILDLLSLSAPISYNYKMPILKNDGTYSKTKINIKKDKNRILTQ